MNITVFDNHEALSQAAAELVIDEIKKKPDLIVCFPTGSTPIRLYEILIEAYQKGKVDFSKVRVRSVDEYVGLSQDHPQSYAFFLSIHLLSCCNFDPKNIELINGAAQDPQAECLRYAQKLKEEGGIDLILDGIGENGHIGFNEPADQLYDHYHLESLSPWTRQVNARFFESIVDVPDQAMSVGVLDLLEAKTFLVLSSGKKKAEVWRRLSTENTLSTRFPASLLKLSQNVHCLIDQESASLMASDKVGK